MASYTTSASITNWNAQYKAQSAALHSAIAAALPGVVVEGVAANADNTFRIDSDVSLDGTQQSALEAVITGWDATTVAATTTEQTSFVEAMRPIIKDWHQGTATTAQTLTATQTVLGNHPGHQAVMFNQIWPSVRASLDSANTGHTGDVPVGGIAGNAVAEALFVRALFDYATRVKTWRD